MDLKLILVVMFNLCIAVAFPVSDIGKVLKLKQRLCQVSPTLPVCSKILEVDTYENKGVNQRLDNLVSRVDLIETTLKEFEELMADIVKVEIQNTGLDIGNAETHAAGSNEIGEHRHAIEDILVSKEGESPQKPDVESLEGNEQLAESSYVMINDWNAADDKSSSRTLTNDQEDEVDESVDNTEDSEVSHRAVDLEVELLKRLAERRLTKKITNVLTNNGNE